MKSILSICFTLLVISQSVFGSLSLRRVDEIPEASPSLCPTCVSFMDQALNSLIQIISNSGVIGTCGGLCGQLPNELEQVVCNLVCDYVGIEALIAALDKVDPDPIWICMEVGICPIADNAAGKIISLSVSPKSGKAGTTFNINVVYAITNATGTGTVEVDILPPDADPFGDAGLIIDYPAGTYSAQMQVQTQPSEQEPFNAGTYQVIAAICEGTCGSTHSHSYIIAQGQTLFTITN